MTDINTCLLCKSTLSCTYLTVIAFYYCQHLNILHRQFCQFESFHLKNPQKTKNLLSKGKLTVFIQYDFKPCQFGAFFTILCINKKLKRAILMLIWINLTNIWFQVSKRGPLEGALKLNKKSPGALQLTFNLLTWKRNCSG